MRCDPVAPPYAISIGDLGRGGASGLTITEIDVNSKQWRDLIFACVDNSYVGYYLDGRDFFFSSEASGG